MIISSTKCKCCLYKITGWKHCQPLSCLVSPLSAPSTSRTTASSVLMALSFKLADTVFRVSIYQGTSLTIFPQPYSMAVTPFDTFIFKETLLFAVFPKV
jgi:hypothetical protein